MKRLESPKAASDQHNAPMKKKGFYWPCGWWRRKKLNRNKVIIFGWRIEHPELKPATKGK